MDVHPVGAMTLLVGVVVATALGPRRLGRLRARCVSAAEHVRLARRRAPEPAGRPIELIARDAQRLGLRFRYVPERVSFARFEGRRQAYDRVLGEACQALGVEHLLEVIPPGPELDTERRRVESVLEQAGLRLDDTP